MNKHSSDELIRRRKLAKLEAGKLESGPEKDALLLQICHFSEEIARLTGPMTRRGKVARRQMVTYAFQAGEYHLALVLLARLIYRSEIGDEMRREMCILLAQRDSRPVLTN